MSLHSLFKFWELIQFYSAAYLKRAMETLSVIYGCWKCFNSHFKDMKQQLEGGQDIEAASRLNSTHPVCTTITSPTRQAGGSFQKHIHTVNCIRCANKEKKQQQGWFFCPYCLICITFPVIWHQQDKRRWTWQTNKMPPAAKNTKPAAAVLLQERNTLRNVFV